MSFTIQRTSGDMFITQQGRDRVLEELKHALEDQAALDNAIVLARLRVSNAVRAARCLHPPEAMQNMGGTERLAVRCSACGFVWSD